MKVISLGWGCQSFALTAMSALGVLPKVDVAIHADTIHERKETYEFAKKWSPWLEEHGMRVVVVRNESNPVIAQAKAGNMSQRFMLPAFASYPNGIPSGQTRRQCTHDWKLVPIRRWLQSNRNKEHIEQWIGITFDEIHRMRPSGVQYITNVYPFIDLLDKPWRRSDVVKQLLDNGLEVPVKSSCVFCPYRDVKTWREIKLSGNGDWNKAVIVDHEIRNARANYVCYLSSKLKPLEEIDFRSSEDKGQLNLFSEECSGYCFL